MRAGALVFFAVLFAAPLNAQQSDPYQALVAELASPEAFDLALRRLLESDMPAAFRSDPDIAVLEEDCPGLIQALVNASTPMLTELNAQGLKEYRVSLRDLLAARLNADEARQAADFFTSELGRRFVRTVSAEATLGGSLTSSLSNEAGSIDRRAFEQDQQASVRSGLAALSPADLQAVNMIFASDWGRAFAALSPEIQELKYRLVNADLTPEQGATVEELSAKAATAYLEACEG